MLLLLSPHADDLALSVGGRLLSPTGWARTPKIAVTLFTASVHAPYSTAVGRAAVTAIRAEEDLHYAAGHSMEMVRLPFGEAMTRGYPSIASLFERRDPRQDPVYAPVREALRDILESRRWSAVVAPLGIGGHIEHLIVREICLDLRASPLLLYEDLPYAADHDNATLDALPSFNGTPRAADVLDCGGVLERKIQMLRDCYPSQISGREVGRLEAYAGRRQVGAARLRSPRATEDRIGSPEVLWATLAHWEQYSRSSGGD